MIDTNVVIIVLGIATTLVVQVGGFVITIYQAQQARNLELLRHGWDMEARHSMTAQVLESRTALIAAVADNTAKTEHGIQAAGAAYREANDVNLKISALGLANLTAITEKEPRA
jgi:hypothetical protein